MLIDRLWSKIDCGESDCWEWTGYRTRGGYGTMKVAGKMRLAHRVSYAVHCGEIREGEGYHGTCVMHRCDNPACVNPAHLLLGTQIENISDRDAKGRQQRRRGEANHQAKLTVADVAAIRAAEAGWGVNARLGRQFGVSANQIAQVRSGKNWGSA